MGLEVATTIAGLVATNPVGATDAKSAGDDHLRMIKDVLQRTFPDCSHLYIAKDSAGSANTYTISLTTTAPSAYVKYMQVLFEVVATNTGASTLNVAGLGAKSLVNSDGSALAPNQLVAGQMAMAMYDGTNFVLLANPNTRAGFEPIGAAQDLASATEAEFTDLSADYLLYMMVLTGVVPTTDNAYFNWFVSTDNGSTYETSYVYCGVYGSSAAAGVEYSAGAGGVLVHAPNGAGNDTDEELNAVIFVLNPMESGQNTAVLVLYGFIEAAGTIHGGLMFGMRASNEANDAMKVAIASSTIASGTAQLYGLRKGT